MESVAKKTGQFNVRIDPSLLPALDEIEAKFRIGQSELVRGLVEAAVAFYRENGYFAFPLKIQPGDVWAEIHAKSAANIEGVLRHSFCSYHVAIHKDAARTAVILCHKSPAMLYQHYRGKATAADAARYFATVPAWFPSP
jgi:hypothetical protein